MTRRLVLETLHKRKEPKEEQLRDSPSRIIHFDNLMVGWMFDECDLRNERKPKDIIVG